MILKVPSGFHSFLWFSFYILFSSMVRISVAVFSTRKPHLGTTSWLLTVVMRRRRKKNHSVESQEFPSRCRAQRPGHWVLHQSLFLLLALSTVTPSATEGLKGGKGTFRLSRRDRGQRPSAPPSSPPSNLQLYLQTLIERLGWIVFISISLESVSPLSCP